MNKFVKLLSSRAGAIVLTILSVAPGLYWYLYLGSNAVEQQMFKVLRHGMLSDVFFLGLVLGAMAWPCVRHSLAILLGRRATRR